MELSPLARRRWLAFRAHRRGWWSLWLFLALFGLSLFAELIANDRPLLVVHEGNWYTPVFRDYPETTFGGEFETPTDYRDPYVAGLIAEDVAREWLEAA